jgi:hypothetical protein
MGAHRMFSKMFTTRYYKAVVKGRHITYILTDKPQFESQYEYVRLRRFSFIDALIPTVYDIKYLIRYTDKNFYDNIEIIGNSIQEFHCKVLFKNHSVNVGILSNEMINHINNNVNINNTNNNNNNNNKEMV